MLVIFAIGSGIISGIIIVLTFFVSIDAVPWPDFNKVVAFFILMNVFILTNIIATTLLRKMNIVIKDTEESQLTALAK